MNIPPNINFLEPELQRIIHSNITLAEDEVKAANRYLQSVLVGSMENVMKSLDETFQKLYKEPQYTGSYYENLRVGHPNEFDINLVLELPIKEEYIVMDRVGTEPGFTKIKVKNVFKPNTSDPVKRKVESWIQNGYLSRPKVINWLQGVVDRALTKVIWPPHMSVELENHVRVRRKMSGPAVTLLVSWGGVDFDVDLVPVFRFGKDKWPAYPIRQPNNLPRNINTTMTWCVVPKAPRRAANDDYQWRMSFYMIEKGLMRDLNNMKPVIKLFKLLRDKQGWNGLSSYYIKTLFMWEQELQKNETFFWRKGLGYLFMHMLIRLEICLKQKTIQFFWDEKSNLIEPLGEHFIRNIEGRVTSLRRLLERALNGTAVNYNSLSEVVEFIFTTPSKSPSRLNTSSLPPSGVYQYSEGNFQNPNNDSSQQTSSITWSAIGIGVGVAAAALVFVGSLLNRNRND